MRNKLKWFISAIFICVLIMTEAINVFASETNTYTSDRYLSDTDAKLFLCFLYNVNYNDIDVSDNEYYKMLTGAISDENACDTLKTGFLTFAQAQINHHIDNANYYCDFAMNDIQAFLEKQVKDMKNLPEEEYDNFYNKQLGYLKDAIIDIFATQLAQKAGIYITEDILDNLNLAQSACSGLVGATAKAKKYADYITKAVEAAFLPMEQELAGRYSYYSVYLDCRKTYSDDTVFDLVMAYNELAIRENYPLGTIDWYPGKKDSWIEHLDLIQKFANATIEIENSLSGTAGGSGSGNHDDLDNTITFISNCSDVPNTVMTYRELGQDASVFVNGISRNGYIFGGWYRDSACTSKVTSSHEMDFSQSCVLYAKWTPMYSYTITDNKITITKLLYTISIDGVNRTDIVIPDTIDGYPVVAIGDKAFQSIRDITSVKIPDSVTSIGEYAFNNCIDLTSIYLGRGINNIEKEAFNYCPSLKNVYISDLSAWCKINFVYYDSNPLNCAENFYINNELITNLEISDDVTEIRNYAFYGCTCLTSVTIPNNVISGNYVFKDCIGLTDINLGSNVHTIPSGTFYGCTKLKNFNIPQNVTQIGTYAFANTGLTKITIPKGVKFDSFVFSNCGDLTTAIIDDGVTEVPDSMFSGCSKLSDVTIPNSVTRIDKEAFEACTGLGNIIIPNSVTNIGSGAFRECTGLVTIKIPDGVTSISDAIFYQCNNLQTIEIGNNVMEIGESAFQATSITDFVIPDSVINIAPCAFEACHELKNITLGKNITTIGLGAFDYCENLTDIILPDSITIIDQWAFKECTGLKNVVFLGKDISIGEEAFVGCNSLTDIYYIGSEEEWNEIIIGDGNEILFAGTTTIHYGKYNIKFNTNGGVINSGNMTSYTCGIGVELPKDITRNGYTFAGWYDNADFAGEAIISISSEDTGDKEYWAKWIEQPPIVTHTHTIVHHKAVAATCTETGTGEYWKCEGTDACNKMFSDADGLTEIAEIPTITATGHNYGAWRITTKMTLTTTGKAERICRNNNTHKEIVDLPILTDTTVWTAGARVEPTETTDGSQVYTSIYGTVTVILPATGREYNFSITYENGKAIVTVPQDGTYTVIFASYDNGRLLSVDAQDIQLVKGENSPISPQNFNADGKVKVMLWDSLMGMKPFCAADEN